VENLLKTETNLLKFIEGYRERGDQNLRRQLRPDTEVVGGANDRFLVNPTIRWRGQEWLLRVEPPRSVARAGRSGIGASRPLPRVPANVP